MLFDNEIVKMLVKYLVQGMAVAVAAFYIPKRKVDPVEILMIAFGAATTLLILDQFAKKVGEYARVGMGFGIGAGQVGYEGYGNLLPSGEYGYKKKEHYGSLGYKKKEHYGDGKGREHAMSCTPYSQQQQENFCGGKPHENFCGKEHFDY